MSTVSRDGACNADAKLAAGVDDNLNVHQLNCDETGTLLVNGTFSPVFPDPLPFSIDQTGNNNVVRALQDGSWTVNLANEPTIDIGIVDQGIPNTLSNAWPVEITDGTNVLGTVAHPVNVTGTFTPPALQNVNLTEIGGATITEGQKTSANSVPVVIASDQSAIPVTGTITTSPNVNVHDGSGNTIASTGTSLNVD